MRQFCYVQFVLLASACPLAHAVSIDLVPVGNPGNAPDTRYRGVAVGDVAYTYQVGKFDVTTSQYCEFLNAVAKVDTYGLYDTFMDSWNVVCQIKRSGSSGDYTYSVSPSRANRPVNYIGWSDAARFCNWLANGQPTGSQDDTTTEEGSYSLHGGLTADRNSGARYVLPTEDEWYKAAYYDPNKPGGAGYWDYPTRSNSAPSNVLSSTGTNNANYYSDQTGYTIDSPYWQTEVGAFANSPSAYGTFDQGGNLWQWEEGLHNNNMRGGSFYYKVSYLHAQSRNLFRGGGFEIEGQSVGFRIAYVPEPATIVMLALASVGMLRRKTRQCKSV